VVLSIGVELNSRGVGIRMLDQGLVLLSEKSKKKLTVITEAYTVLNNVLTIGSFCGL
jgi:hypothetical protein